MESIKYIENDKNKGIEYNWKKIFKEFNKLNVPPNVYNPTSLPFKSAKYFTLLSERSTGKTTNLLLIGMIMNKHYDTIIHYIRQREDMITNKNINDLFKTIKEFKYIEKITDNKYNDVIYKSRRWYYINRDNDGNIIEIAPSHFMFCCSVDKSYDLKSSYNCPVGDLIIFDEFISKFYYPNEFVTFEDLLSTIIRKRLSPIVCLLANTIDKNSQYFSELCIYDSIQKMQIGEKDLIETDMGTRVYVEIIKTRLDKTQSEEKKRHNNLYFGFPNKELGSITGVEWATKSYQHIDSTKEFKMLSNNHYLKYNSKMIQFEIVDVEDVGICVYAHKSTKTYRDSIIYTINDIVDSRYRYKFGYGKIDTLIWKLYDLNRFFYSDNTVGSIVANYIKQAKKIISGV